MDVGGNADRRTGGSGVSYLDDHPIARRVVEQRMREAVYDWAVVHEPDVVDSIRFTVLYLLDKEAENVGER